MRHLLTLLIVTAIWTSLHGGDEPRLNVLMIAVDDLRPQLGCYGDQQAKTPNIDALARKGFIFDRAYCQQAICSPSRTSLLTGLRPDKTRVYDLKLHFRRTLPDVVTLPQYFKNNGYQSVGFGKIYHGSLDDALSWSEPHTSPGAGKLYGPDGQKIAQQEAASTKGRNNKPRRGPAFEAASVDDDGLADGVMAGEASTRLKQLAAARKPFFLAVGFIKPHLPFVAPKKYWDLYDPKKLPRAPYTQLPTNAPEFSSNYSGELRVYAGIPASGPVSDETERNLVHGYYAATSYMDAQVGRVLKALEESGVADRTIIVLWGDHGWQLGEHGTWCKHTNFEAATRVPLIVAAPKFKKTGKTLSGLVELVDLYPSLVELAGLPTPAFALDGKSFVPLLNGKKQIKPYALSQYPRRSPALGGPIMGYSLRTDRYRLTEWSGSEGSEWELYDYRVDPHETLNRADDPRYTKTRKELETLLKEARRGSPKPNLKGL